MGNEKIKSYSLKLCNWSNILLQSKLFGNPTMHAALTKTHKTNKVVYLNLKYTT